MPYPAPNTNWLDMLNAGMRSTSQPQSLSGLSGLGQYGGAISNMGYSQLGELLSRGGRTDPAMFNREMAGISSGNQQQMSALQGILAQRGIGNSGIGQALGSAIGQAGQSQLAGRRAQESQMMDQRQRQNMELLLEMLVNPSLSWEGMRLGQANIDRERNDKRRSDRLNRAGGILGTIGSLFGFCWVAEEIFRNPQDEDAVRAYMATDPELAALYLEGGKQLAFHVKHDEDVRRIVVPRFHEFADIGYQLEG